MHMVHDLLWFVVVWHWQILPISFRVTSLVLGQSNDCSSASEATHWEEYEQINHINLVINHNITTAKQSITQPCALTEKLKSSWCQLYHHWWHQSFHNQVFITTSSNAPCDDKFGIMITVGFHHDANFVITGGTEVVIITSFGATCDDKVGIMTTLGFQCILFDTM